MSLPYDQKPFKKYTYGDYLTWPDDQRWEIIEGVPYQLAPPLRIHQEIVGELFRQISNFLVDKPCRVYTAPFGVRLPKGNEGNDNEIETILEPDITVVCDQSKLDVKGCKGAPDLVIEVISLSSAKADRVLKFNFYEKSGVKEYWVVQPEEKTVMVFVRGDDHRYGRPEVYSEEDQVAVGIFQDLTIDLKTVFNR